MNNGRPCELPELCVGLFIASADLELVPTLAYLGGYLLVAAPEVAVRVFDPSFFGALPKPHVRLP